MPESKEVYIYPVNILLKHALKCIFCRGHFLICNLNFCCASLFELMIPDSKQEVKWHCNPSRPSLSDILHLVRSHFLRFYGLPQIVLPRRASLQMPESMEGSISPNTV